MAIAPFVFKFTVLLPEGIWKKRCLGSRKAYAVILPIVEYTVTNKRGNTIPLIEMIIDYGKDLTSDAGIIRINRISLNGT